MQKEATRSQRDSQLKDAKFAHFFAIDGKVNWSAETTESVRKQLNQLEPQEKANLEDFLENPLVGGFIPVSNGYLVCTNV